MTQTKYLLIASILGSSLISYSAFSGEYQKIFACSEALKNEMQTTNRYITKDVVLLAAKNGKPEGMNLYTPSNIYFCKLPNEFFKKGLVEKAVRMKIALPKRRALFISYQRSLRDPQNFEAINLVEQIDRSLSKSAMAQMKEAHCEPQNSSRNEKLIADFMRSRISQVHSNSADEATRSMASTSSVDALRLCQKSFLLRSTAEREIAKFMPKQKPQEGGMFDDTAEDQNRLPASQ